MIRDLIWAYPLAFVWIVCIGATTIAAIGVVACFSIKQDGDDK